MNNFRGWKTVFSFNYKQNSSSKSYIAVTVLGAVLIIAASILLSVLAAKPEKKEEELGETISIGKVYILDLVGVGELKFEEWLPQLEEDYYFGLEFTMVEHMTKEELQVMAAQEEEFAIGVVIEQEEDVISVSSVIPSTFEDISLIEGQEIAELVASCVEKARIEGSGFSEFQIDQIQKEVVVAIADVGEEQDAMVYLVRYIAPAVFGLVLYFLLLLYGQNINQGVSVEKTSKLVETLLTSIHPYALLSGKVFAIVATAMQQFFLWIVALVIGVIVGNKVAFSMYPDTAQSLESMISFLRENIGQSALSPVAVVLALITFCCGFLFYCVVAGMAGSMVNRPEEAANTQSIFTLPIVFSWLICYLGTLMEKEGILMIARNIPFTIPFCVPVDLLTGAIGIVQGLISTVILLVFSILVIMLSGRIYKGIVLYTGEKLTFKNIVGILKNK